MQKVMIAQMDHYRKNGFGMVLRSSGIFYYRRADGFKTTVTFMNYWKVKRDIDVTVVASIRDMDGRLMLREEVGFESGHVLNYAPELPEYPFEGSIEIEVFSIRNMVIPFAAIIVIYETSQNVTLTHNYSRAYSPHEIEEGRMITVGEESCWTLRDGDGIRSFSVMHNGIDPQPAQTARFTVSRPDGARRTIDITLPELPPYGTYRFTPADHIADLDAFLGGQPGNGALSYKLKRAFTRMLIGNERVGTPDFQVTHSNFNYAIHKTDEVAGDNALAHMMVPDGAISGRHVRVYPDCDNGQYEMTTAGGDILRFSTGDIVDIPSEPGNITFRKLDGSLPTRLVTAIVGENRPGQMPFELSLGILHGKRPPKRLWWAPTAMNDATEGRIVATTYDQLYGAYAGQPVNIRLYSAHTHTVLEAELDAGRVRQMSNGLRLDEIFPSAADHLAGGFGWFDWYSDYGGFQVFTMMSRIGGSSAMEHGF